MNNHALSKRSYMLLWLNSATSTAMAQYMMYSGFSPLVYLFPWICSAVGYRYGYFYATQGREVPRKAYLVLFAVYTGLFAIPPLTRMFWLNFHPILFSYACGRLLVFRAVWLTKHFEAYLHLLLYAVIVFACMAHERADFTLLLFVVVHIVMLLLALYSFYYDRKKEVVQRFPVVSLVQGFLAVILVSVLLGALLPAVKLWNFQLIPDKVGKISLSKDGDAVDRAMEYLTSKGMTANPESSLGNWILEKLKIAYAYYQHAPSLQVDLRFLLFWLIAWGLLLSLWVMRHYLALMLLVLLVDPIRISYISDKRNHERKDVMFLYRAYERLWKYKGIMREPSMTPLEHLFVIARETKGMAKPSMKIMQTFQAVRYGEKHVGSLVNEIKEYVLLRNTVAPGVDDFFGKQFRQEK